MAGMNQDKSTWKKPPGLLRITSAVVCLAHLQKSQSSFKFISLP